MVVLKSLLAATLASTAWATKVIVPLYSWNEQCWPELQQAACVPTSLSCSPLVSGLQVQKRRMWVQGADLLARTPAAPPTPRSSSC